MKRSRRPTHLPRKDDMLATITRAIGEPMAVLLCQEFGGTRLYVPLSMHSDHEIAGVIGLEAATKLAAVFSPDVIKVPLARELRAVRYRNEGKSYAQIARKLGITEAGVEKLVRRVREREAAR